MQKIRMILFQKRASSTLTPVAKHCLLSITLGHEKRWLFAFGFQFLCWTVLLFREFGIGTHNFPTIGWTLSCCTTSESSTIWIILHVMIICYSYELRPVLSVHFAEDVGPLFYEEISEHFMKGLKPEDLQPQFQHMVGSDHLETCYVIFNIDQETTCWACSLLKDLKTGKYYKLYYKS